MVLAKTQTPLPSLSHICAWSTPHRKLTGLIKQANRICNNTLHCAALVGSCYPRATTSSAEGLSVLVREEGTAKGEYYATVICYCLFVSSLKPPAGY